MVFCYVGDVPVYDGGACDVIYDRQDGESMYKYYLVADDTMCHGKYNTLYIRRTMYTLQSTRYTVS